MDFCKEYWTLVSSLEWADQAPGGLLGFNNTLLSELSIVALKQDLKEICGGLHGKSTEQERAEWSSKMTGVFAWKWLLSSGEFESLRPMSHFNLRRFKELNLNLCYEIVKSNKWANCFCDFLQAFDTGTYLKMTTSFLSGILSVEGFPSNDDDIKFCVRFLRRILTSFVIDEKYRKITRHPLVPHQPQSVHELSPRLGREVIKLLMKVMSRIFEASRIISNSDFQLALFAITSFLNCVSSLLLGKVLVVSSIDGAQNSCSYDVIFDGDDVSPRCIMTFDVTQLEILDGSSEIENSCKSEVMQSQSCSDLFREMHSFLSFCDDFSKNSVVLLGEIIKKSEEKFVGFGRLDVCLEMFLGLFTSLEHCESLKAATNREVLDRHSLREVLESLRPLKETASSILEVKRSDSFKEEFMLMVALMKAEAKRDGYKDCFMKSLLYKITNKALVARQVKLMQEDRDLIGSSEDYLAIHDYTARLQKADSTTIGALKKVLQESFLRFDWPTRDKVVYELNINQSERVSVVEDTKDLERRWTPCLNRVSNADHGIHGELSFLVSLFLLSDVRSLFDSVMSEVVSKTRIVKVVAELLSQFPKTLTLESSGTEGSSILLDSFLSAYSSLQAPKKKNLLSFMESLLIANVTGTRVPLIDEFSLACIMPNVGAISKTDLPLVEMYLRVLTKMPVCSTVVKFTFASLFLVLCSLLEELHFGVLPLILPSEQSNCSGGGDCANVREVDIDGDIVVGEGGGDEGADVNSAFERKCRLLHVVETWKEVFAKNFSEEPAFNELLKSELEKFTWWTQNHFLGSLLRPFEKPSLSRNLEGLLRTDSKPPQSAPPDSWRTECFDHLLDFVEISDSCLDFSLQHFNLESLRFHVGDVAYNALVWKVCRSLMLSTSSEWTRKCSILMEMVAVTEQCKGDAKRIDKALIVCHLISDAFALLKVLQRETEDDELWNVLPWNRLCQHLRSFLETFIEKSDLVEEPYNEILKLCGRVCAIIPSPRLVDLMHHLL